MLVETMITYRTDYVPRRGRNVRKGHASDIVPMSIREVGSDEAPAVLTFRENDRRIVVRTCGGLLYEPTTNRDGSRKEIVKEVARIAPMILIRLGLGVGVEGFDDFAFQDEPRIVSSQRDFAIRHLQAGLSTELLVVDGVLHERTRSPLVLVVHFGRAYDPGSEELVRSLRGMVLEATGCRHVPAWFPPRLGDTSFADAVCALERGCGASRRKNPVNGDVFASMDVEVLDADLFDAVGRDPRNLDLGKVVRDALDAYGHSRDHDEPARRGSKAMPGLTELLYAVAGAEAEAGATLAEIERLATSVARPSDVSHLRGDDDGAGIEGSTIALHIADGAPFLSVLDPISVRLLVDMDPPRLLFRGRDAAWAVEIATSADRRHAEEYRRALAGPRVDRWEEAFDFEGWNLRVAIGHVLSRIDDRVELLPKHVLDAVVRLTVHQRDWRTDPRLVEAPGAEAAFVRDAGVVVDMLDGPELADVGDEWYRQILRSSHAVLASRPSGGMVVEDDPELRNFAF